MSAECLMCDTEGRDKVTHAEWTLDGLEWMYGDGQRRDFSCAKLCTKHQEFCRTRIAELRALNPDLPPRPKSPEEALALGDQREREGKTFELYTREPGEDG